MRLFRHHAVAVDIYKSLGLNLSLRIYCGISCRSSSQKLRDSSDGSNNQNLAGLRPHKEKVLGAASCTPGISGLGAENRSTSWASPEAWAQRTPAGCEGPDPEVPGARSCSGFGTRLCWGFHSNLHLHLASGHRCNSARSWPSQASAGVRGGGVRGRGGAGS